MAGDAAGPAKAPLSQAPLQRNGTVRLGAVGCLDGERGCCCCRMLLLLLLLQDKGMYLYSHPLDLVDDRKELA